MKLLKSSYLFILLGIVLIFLKAEISLLSVASLIVGVVIIVLVGEPMVEGLKEFSLFTGLSEHVTGIISSLASNLPEAVMTFFMVVSPHLKEVAILTVMLASTFNGLLLGLLIIMLTYRGGIHTLIRNRSEARCRNYEGGNSFLRDYIWNRPASSD